MPLREKDTLLGLVNTTVIDFPTPALISYMWGLGSLLGVFLMFQLISGLFLAMHYIGDVSMSFFSVIHMMRDVNYGWQVRVIHSNGASLMFLFLNFHLGRGIYYGSFKSVKTWQVGVSIYLLSMIIAFLGYVLPWGQMSFWAATVITNLLTAIPYVGLDLVKWVWGGFAVSSPTLTRFFMLHYLLPFIMVVLVGVHLLYLHESGSSNPLGVEGGKDKVCFHPYFVISDLLGVFMALMVLFVISFLFPYLFMDAENFMVSNPMVTPVHIQPEWYFLFAYSILRSIPSSVGGVLALFLSVLLLYLFPVVSKNFGGSYLVYSVLFWVMVVNWVMLTWVGACEVVYPFVELGKIFSFMYFFIFVAMFFSISFQDGLM